MRGKTIRLYIMGDEFKNLKEAELSNWTGKTYIGERKHIKIIQKIDELRTPGVYLLLSEEEKEIRREVYVGEADDVAKRMTDHFRKKEWWERFIIFISKDSNLTKAHVRYLENKAYNIVELNKTSMILKNEKESTSSKLPISDIDDMEDFFENMIFVLKNLGLIDFSKTSEKIEIISEEIENIFYINLTSDRVDKENKILQAKMIITKDGYKLLKDSFIEKTPRDSFKRHSYYPLRQQFESNEYIVESNYAGCYRLIQDIDFSSPSAAASIVKNRATNGRKEWCLSNGISLDDFESNQP